MEYIWNMGLTGSILWILYLVVKPMLSKCFNYKWKYSFLKCILLYFLIPLPFLKDFYVNIGEKIFLRGQYQNQFAIYSHEGLLLRWEDEIYLNQPMRLQLWTIGIWVGVAAVLLLGQCAIYLQEKKRLFRYSAQIGQEDAEWCSSLEKKYSLRLKVTYIDSTPGDSRGSTAFTIGVLHPIILFPGCRSLKDKQLIVEHELIHVKQCDILWKVLMSGVCILHWYNPLVWWVKKEFTWTTELACDERLMRGKDIYERGQYAELLVSMSRRYAAENSWSAALSKNGKKLKERVEDIMAGEKKCFGGVVSALIVGAAVFLNSFTVLAYPDTQVLQEDTAWQGAEVNDILEGDISFVPDEEDAFKISCWKDDDIAVLYDCQFIDKEGNVYSVDGEDTHATVYSSCNHEYVDGQYQVHKRNSSGGCTITAYDAKRCTKCGYVVVGDKVFTTIYEVCPH